MNVLDDGGGGLGNFLGLLLFVGFIGGVIKDGLIKFLSWVESKTTRKNEARKTAYYKASYRYKDERTFQERVYADTPETELPLIDNFEKRARQ